MQNREKKTMWDFDVLHILFETIFHWFISIVNQKYGYMLTISTMIRRITYPRTTRRYF